MVYLTLQNCISVVPDLLQQLCALTLVVAGSDRGKSGSVEQAKSDEADHSPPLRFCFSL